MIYDIKDEQNSPLTRVFINLMILYFNNKSKMITFAAIYFIL